MSQLAVAKTFEVSTSRVDSNIYLIEGEDILIHTRLCKEKARNNGSVLRMQGHTGELEFTESGSRCEVKAVYGLSEQDPGTYKVKISREDDNWYEIWKLEIYIKTDACPISALVDEALLTMNDGVTGTLVVREHKCKVEGVYSRMNL